MEYIKCRGCKNTDLIAKNSKCPYCNTWGFEQ